MFVGATPHVEIHGSPSKNTPMDLLQSKIMRVVSNHIELSPLPHDRRIQPAFRQLRESERHSTVGNRATPGDAARLFASALYRPRSLQETE